MESRTNSAEKQQQQRQQEIQGVNVWRQRANTSHGPCPHQFPLLIARSLQLFHGLNCLHTFYIKKQQQPLDDERWRVRLELTVQSVQMKLYSKWVRWNSAINDLHWFCGFFCLWPCVQNHSMCTMPIKYTPPHVPSCPPVVANCWTGIFKMIICETRTTGNTESENRNAINELRGRSWMEGARWRRVSRRDDDHNLLDS